MAIHPISQTLRSLKVELNRLKTQQIVLERKVSKQQKSERRARTRTLIQLGGLVSMIGLTDMCGIVEGEDLQLDMSAQDKAATLLGMLVTLIEQLPPTLSDEQEKTFKQKGIRALKMYSYQTFLGKNNDLPPKNKSTET